MAFAILVPFLLIVALGGGSARFDTQSVILVRLAAVCFIMALAFMNGRQLFAGPKAPLWFALAAAGLVALQLVPLPPGIWTALPGRGFVAEAAAVAGIDQPWRPITMTPGPTMNSLAALIVPIAALLGVRLLGRWGRQRLIVLIFGLILVSAVLAMLQVADGPNSPLRTYRFTNEEFGVGLFANRNHQAMLIATGFPILAYFNERYGVPGRKLPVALLTIGAGLFLLTTILVTGSRMGLLLGAIAIALSALNLAASRRISRRSLLGAAAATAAVAGTLLALGLSQAKSLSRLMTLDPSDDLRFVLLGDFMKMAKEFFPFGSGFGSFPYVYPHFERLETMSPKYVNHAHDDLLEIVIEGGLAPLLLLVLFLGWLVARAFRTYRGRDGSDAESAARLGIAATVLLLLGCLTDYPLRTPLMAVLFVCYCSFALPSRATRN